MQLQGQKKVMGGKGSIPSKPCVFKTLAMDDIWLESDTKIEKCGIVEDFCKSNGWSTARSVCFGVFFFIKYAYAWSIHIYIFSQFGCFCYYSRPGVLSLHFGSNWHIVVFSIILLYTCSTVHYVVWLWCNATSVSMLLFKVFCTPK